MKKIFNFLICFLIVTFLCLTNINLVEASGNSVYEDEFNYTCFESSSLYDSAVWSAEKDRSRPSVEDGVLKASKGYSLSFNYQKINGFVFDASKTYTISFDVKITSFGDDSGLGRELYVAPGGWYNQIELKSSADKAIRTGDNYVGKTGVEYKLNTLYNVEILWEPSLKKITSTLKENGKVLSTGYRTNNEYGSNASYLSNWVFRCEDGAYEMDNFSFTYGTMKFSEDFEFESNDKCMSHNGYWALETLEKTGTAPEFKDGVLKFDDKDSIEFLWTKLVDYSTENIYSFEFDVKVTGLGDGSSMGADTQTRVLYVAPGGYYNQVQLYTLDQMIIAGESSVAFDSAKYLNKTLHVKIGLQGDTISSSIYDQNNNLIVSGFRTNGAYTNMVDRNKTMARMVLRCEDGSCEIDNFVFSEQSVKTDVLDTFEVSDDKAMTYTCTLDYTLGNDTSLKLNGSNILSLSSSTMKVCSGFVKGSYGSGSYKIKLYVNKSQSLVSVEVTLPDGGVVRRGTYDLINKTDNTYSISLVSNSSDSIKDINKKITDVKLNEYTLTKDEPVYEGANEFIYNIISSFSDASTTRNFAWTTQYADVDMVVKYRVKGNLEWNVVEGIKEDEAIDVEEDYFKADLVDLTPDTEYEFKIGILDADDDSEYDWTKVYSFKTASSEIDEFTFVAVGDTQGMTWHGTSTSNKGFMYAKSAYEQALKEVENPAFILHAGDVVENGDNKKQWNYFFKALGDAGASIPHFAAIGNHDVVSKGSDPRFYFDLHFNHPNNGGSEKLNQYHVNKIRNTHLKRLAEQADETFYSFDYGDAHFIVLNTGNYSSDDRYIIEAQRQWLENDLELNKCAKWTVILFHEPVYHRLGGNESRPWLNTLIESYNVDLVIQGHSHLVTRTYPMKDGKIVTKLNPDQITQGVGTVYTTIGSTALNHDGMGSTNVEECMLINTPIMQQSAYTTVTIKNDKLIMTVKQTDGLVLDSFTILASGEKGHTGEEEVVNRKEATCEDGYTGDIICSSCKKVISKGEVIKAIKDHTYGEWTIIKEATKDEVGLREHSCTVCGYKVLEEYSASKGCSGSVGITLTGLSILSMAIYVLKRRKNNY
jgi:predicted phosphodiesterase